ncbi:MAG: acyltransferase, partial [Propionibacteriales bacterium]|nr:acyltransferase [Propionibacteriales bacterium]
LAFAALSLIPRRRSWTTRQGERTFYSYLLHGYVILILKLQFGVFDRIEQYGVLAVIGTMIVAVILANLLMTKIVSRVFRPVFEPRLEWMFRTTR